MKSQNESKLDEELKKKKIMFNNSHGEKNKNTIENVNDISPEEVAKEILAYEIKQEYKSDDKEDTVPKVVRNLNQNPARFEVHDSEDSGLPDSACELASDSDN
mmetsp:Transcript_2416/g.2841  ORF Transcript_2416/g.2841 Transcript_2416/m.2841 type:complete len:103 (-) Transcript_2416:60-368(-)